MTVVVGTYGDNTSAGWTSITGMANTFYVSAVGNDSWDGTAPNFVSGTTGPKLTIDGASGGNSVIPNGNTFTALLLRRGDTFTMANGGIDLRFKDGVNSSQPLLYGTYGTGARPIVKVPNGTNAFQIGATNAITNLAIIGWDFYGYQYDPQSVNFDGSNLTGSGFPTAIAVDRVMSSLLIENCRTRYLHNLDIGSSLGLSSGLIIRRNQLVGAYSLHLSAMQNMLIADQNAGWIIEENVMDMGGWNSDLIQPQSSTITQASPGVVTFSITLPSGSYTPPNGSYIQFAQSGGGITAGAQYISLNKSGGTFQISTDGVTPINTTAGLVSPQNVYFIGPEPTAFNRNCYMSEGGPTGKGTWRGNISTRSASSGAQVRPGGDVYDNLFIKNFEGLVLGSGGQSDSFTINYVNAYNNVVLNADDIHSIPPQVGGTGGEVVCADTTVNITNNIFSNTSSSGGLSFSVGATVVNAVVTGNITFNWVSGIAQDPIGGLMPSNLTITNAGSGYVDGVYEHGLLTGGSGTGSPQAWTTISGGIVTKILPSNPSGHGFVIGDTLGLNNASVGGSGSGAVLTVTEVGTAMTASNNPTNLPGTIPWLSYPDPGRTIERYDTEILGGPGTFNDFIAAALNQDQPTWNANLTAINVNTYIRDGFGGASPPATSTTGIITTADLGNKYGVYKSRPTKIPLN
jgi:hypothetical protein